MEKIVKDFLENQNLKKDEFVELIRAYKDPEAVEALKTRAVELRKKYYGDQVFTRGLIEFTNYCKNDCYYCGIRKSNRNADRYRLTEEEILTCCENGYELGFRTFVLQGGEDPYYTDERMESIIRKIKKGWPDCALTLSMVGSPGQTDDCLAEDLVFLQELKPQMVGIGPFIPHHDTRFAQEPAGSVELTLYLLSVIRIMLPKVLLPATTALGTMDPRGREKGLERGANVVMPNLSPVKNRKAYELYDNKICTGEEAAECRGCLSRRVESVGYHLVSDRGDAVE